MNSLKRPGRPGTIISFVAYEAMGETETNEGRGPRRHIGWFKNADLAHAAVKGQGVMGADGYVRTFKFDVVVYVDPLTNKQVAYRLSEEKFHIEFIDDDEVKARALAKLTLEERRALGL